MSSGLETHRVHSTSPGADMGARLPKVKSKVVLYLIKSVGHTADLGFLAVSPQVTES